MQKISLNNLDRFLDMRRLPARITGDQTSQILGFQPHDIPLLVKAGLLTPLGGARKNCVKFFAAIEIEALSHDKRWLDKATKALIRRSAKALGSGRIVPVKTALGSPEQTETYE